MKSLKVLMLLIYFYISLIGGLFKKNSQDFPYPDFNNLYDETIF